MSDDRQIPDDNDGVFTAGSTEAAERSARRASVYRLTRDP